MQAFKPVSGKTMPLNRKDVDTDQILPAQYLKRIERTGFGPFAFEAWRKDPNFIMNDDRYTGSPVLVAGSNFGCGSSREAAPWALEDAGFKVIIAGAGGAAHLPGMTAALTSLPVFGVPVESKALSGLDSLYSIVQMPPGVPVGTLAIGQAGAINAALLAASVLALSDPTLGNRLEAWRQRQTASVAEQPKDGV